MKTIKPQDVTANGAARQEKPAGGFSMLTVIGFMFLLFNSGMAIYQNHDDLLSVAFVVVSFTILVLLFASLHILEQTPLDDKRRRYHLKIAVWLLSTALTILFSYKVAVLMPLPVAVIVWLMAGSTICAGFYLFFLHKEVSDTDDAYSSAGDFKKAPDLA